MLTPWSGTCSSNGVLLTEKTPGSARSESCCPSCSKGWSEGSLPPPSKSMLLQLLPTTTPWKGCRWGSMTGSSGSLGGQEGWTPHPPPPPYPWDSQHYSRACSSLCRQSSRSSKEKGKLYSCLHWPPSRGLGTCTHLGRRFVPRVWTGRFPNNPEAPARLCAQGSHYSLQSQVVSLQALPPEEADPALALLCPVWALTCYVDRTQTFRTSDQLFVCHRGQQKGNAVSKHGMVHWIVVAITLAYQAQGVPCPFRLRAHSTRSTVSSWVLAHGTRWQIFVELRAGRALTRSLDSIAFMWNQFPGRSTEGFRFQVGLLKTAPESPYCRPCRAPPSPRQPDVAEHPAPGPHSMNPWEPVEGWVPYV